MAYPEPSVVVHLFEIRSLRKISPPQSEVIDFLAGFAGRGFSVRLLLAILLSSVLDLLGIAVIFPYLHVVLDEASQMRLLAYLPMAMQDIPRGKVLVLLSLGLIAAYLLKSFIQVALLRYQNQRLAELTTRLTNDAVNHLLHARYALYLQIPGSDIGATAFTGPIHASLVFRAALQMLNELAFFSMLFLAFVVISPLAALGVLLILMAVGLALYLKVIRNTARLGRQQADAEKARYRLLFSIINAIRDIKVMGLAGLFESVSMEVSSSFEKAAWRYNYNHALPLMAIEVAVLLGVVGTVMAGILMEVDIVHALPVIGVVGVAAVRLVPAVAKFFMALNSFRFYSESVLRFVRVRRLLVEARHKKQNDGILFRENISLSGVTFKYGEKTVLDNISLTIETGKSYGIVGPSGSGKSTLLDIFTGLQVAAGGVFTCDGVRFDPFLSASLSTLVGYVPQNITLIDDSIAFNIAFEHDYDEERMAQALKMANLESLVANLPEGVKTPTGENGNLLSGGQRQRVGIARAFYRNPSILVMDEATSALDPITEREISRELAALKGRITLLIVSHRTSAVEDCDEIIVMAHGRVVSSGRHEDLLASSQLYKNLFQAQSQSQ